MNRKLPLRVALVLTGIVNALPLSGTVSADLLGRLYGIDPPSGDLLILLRHRALLFGLLGALMITAAFRVHLQGGAVAAGVISMAGFVALAWLQGGYGPGLRKVVITDLVACFVLLAAAIPAGASGFSHRRPAVLRGPGRHTERSS